MPLFLLVVGLVLTVAAAVRLSPFGAAAGPDVPGYALLVTGLLALTMTVPWMIVHLILGLQRAFADGVAEAGDR